MLEEEEEGGRVMPRRSNGGFWVETTNVFNTQKSRDVTTSSIFSRLKR